MINLSNVAVLLEAVQAGSLAAVARRLRTTPMLASRRLAALEQEVGRGWFTALRARCP
ncbi:helix-turn-helix domain-containing protein [Teichococcus vastitatis]|jgi:DNA-binding transcriptional LysR family regulator|uniref:LysR family transcriptional regulator n=1 Tax=Teichococcus vastitatis TaxID=2307076 RepID=A0ABS9W2C9_9PROT|nr:LysR family transcriptional regulator [Pseudoroseomonas vastitatis]MCI0753447.1 LysR family transcriptional regulator [Pseudoroseomonas vastitatis]